MRRLKEIIYACVFLMFLANCFSCDRNVEKANDITEAVSDKEASSETVAEMTTDSMGTQSVTEDEMESSTTEKVTEEQTTIENEIEKESTTEETIETDTTIEMSTEQVTTQICAKKLDVSCILQNPELPSGCEITSLTIVLGYYGIDVDKCFLSDNYLKKGKPGSVDIYEAFIGDPRDPYSYGCYAPPLVECANTYLQDIDSNLMAYNVSYTEFYDLLAYIDNAIPVIIWNTEDVKQSSIGKEWIVNGEQVVWLRGQHCLVMTGYDKENNYVYVADPMKGNVKYPLDVFAKRYKEMMMQAVVVY